MRIDIETYRGATISFDNEREVFSCFLDDYGKESKSYSAVKKGIDEFLKENNTFKPFDIVRIPSQKSTNYNKDKHRVIGIRKDGRFMIENEEGVKKQLSDWDEKNWMLDNPKDEPLFLRLAYLHSLVQDAQNEVNTHVKSIPVTLVSQIKSNYIN